MKNICYLLISCMFLFSCKKEKEYVITGVVVDSFTQRPVSGIHVGYFTLGSPHYTTTEPYVSYSFTYQQLTVTDQSGRFDFALPDDPDQKYYLTSENLYDRYKSQALINGNHWEFQIYPPNTTISEPDKYFLRLTQSADLSIQIDPKPLCRFDYPAIPGAWAGYGCYILSQDISASYFYNAADGLGWLKQQVFAVSSADQHMKGSFRIQESATGVIHQEGNFDEYCAVGDTTVVWLEW